MNRLRRHPILLLLGLIGVLAGGGLWFRSARGVAVVPVHASRGPLVQTVVTSGRVRPQRLRLSPLATGRVANIAADVGERVAPGQLLLQLDDREAAARVAEAEAGLASARLQRRSLGSLQRDQAQELLTQARVRTEEARRDVTRLRGLAASGAVAKKALLQASTALELSESALRDASAQRDALGQGGVRARTAEATVRQAEAGLALARARLDYHRIRAPKAGVIISRQVEAGDVVQAGQGVFELAATAQTELFAELDERNLAVLALGQRALASPEAFPDQRVNAEVVFISPAVNPDRGTVEVRLAVAEPTATLRPDMTVSIDIEVARRPNALTLPLRAVRDLAGAPHVLVMRGGLAVHLPVGLGIRDDQRVEVTRGLSEQDRVIADPGSSPGDRVRERRGGAGP